MKLFLKLMTLFVGIVAVTGSFLGGWYLRGAWGKVPQGPSSQSTAAAKAELWLCPMHPQIQLPKPGKCPICTMDLVLQDADSGGGGPRTLEMSEESKKLAEIVTTEVERRVVTHEVRMVGKLDYDETRVKTISAWVPGRLDRLYVDYTGISVAKGDHLVLLYSPEMLMAQEELIESKKQVDAGRDQPSAYLRKSDLRTLDSAREKLRLWGLTAEQIAKVEKRGKAEDHVLITSPTAGVVIHKALNQGDYVKTGTPIYRIADLSHLWVHLDAYESDLVWIRYGQEVSLETEAYPGERFRGWISFIAPFLDDKTRTVKVRVIVDNKEARLKPGMFVRTVVRSRLGQGGRVMDPRLVDKWICPMHPEVVEDAAGACRICEMPMVPAKDLGYAAPATRPTQSLVVPASAVLVTGKRGVVYVEVPGKERPTYEGREVVLGPRAGDYYVILDGLAEGERVVVHGNFKIDSALQIKAKRSMMSLGPGRGGETGDQREKEDRGSTTRKMSQPSTMPTTREHDPTTREHDPTSREHDPTTREHDPTTREHDPTTREHDHDAAKPPAVPKDGAFLPALQPVYDAYFRAQDALARDKLDEAKAAFAGLDEALGKVGENLAPPTDRQYWAGLRARLIKAVKAGAGSTDLESARAAFRDASEAIIVLERKFGHQGSAIYYQMFCPMTFGEGAAWLQTSDKVLNPYYGASMLTLGSLKHRYPGNGNR